jgi:predicted MFS family arabinose efflux permease
MPGADAGHLRIPDLLILAVGTFILGVDRYLLTGLLPQVSGDLHVSMSAVGQLATIFGLVYAVSSPVIGAWAARWERRRLLALGMVVFLLGIGLQATAVRFSFVGAGSVLAGLGAAAYQPTAYASAGLLSSPETRARSLAVVAGGGSVALVLGVPLGIRVGQLWGWRPSLWILTGLAIAAIAFLGVFPRVFAPPAHERRWQVLTDRRVLSLVILSAVILAPGFLMVTYLPTILQSSGGLVPMTMLAFGCGGLAGTALVPVLINWLGARFALLVGASGVTLFAALLVISSGSPAGTVATFLAIGVSGGLTVVPQQHRLLGLVEPAAASIAIGLNGSAIYIGSALGAAIGGAVLSAFDTSALGPAAAGLGLLAIGLCVLVRPDSRPPALVEDAGVAATKEKPV